MRKKFEVRRSCREIETGLRISDFEGSQTKVLFYCYIKYIPLCYNVVSCEKNPYEYKTSITLSEEILRESTGWPNHTVIVLKLFFVAPVGLI